MKDGVAGSSSLHFQLHPVSNKRHKGSMDRTICPGNTRVEDESQGTESHD